MTKIRGALRRWWNGPDLPAASECDRAVARRQDELLREKDDQITALQVELEATLALVDPDRDAQVAWLRQQCAVFRARWVYWQGQAELAAVMLRHLQERRV